jgi:hypothetical protein
VSRRRTAHMPFVSMLDLLFGTFGAVVAIAALLTLLRQQESRIDSEEFFYVAAQVASPTAGAKNYLSATFISFELSANDAPPQTFAPRMSPSGVPADLEYFAHTLGDTTSASLLLSKSALSRLPGGRLRARLHNLPSLLFDVSPPASPETTLQVSLMIKRKEAACATTFDTKLSTLADKEQNSKDGPLSLFAVVADAEGRLICTRDKSPSGGSQFGVSDGLISLQ